MNISDKQLIKIRTTQLLEKWANEGDTSARNEVFELNQKFVYFMAYRFRNVMGRMLEFDDLVSLCEIGLLKAIDAYELTNSCPFSTYAFQTMRNEVRMELRRTKHVKDEISLDQKISLPSGDNVDYADMIAGKNNIDEFIEHDSSSSEFDFLTQFLSQADRDFVKLVYFYEANNDEIAKEFNINSDDVLPYLKNIIKCSKHRMAGLPRVSLFEQRDLILHNDNFVRYINNNFSNEQKGMLQAVFQPQKKLCESGGSPKKRLYLEDEITRFKLATDTDIDFGIGVESGTKHRFIRVSEFRSKEFFESFPKGIRKLDKVVTFLSPSEKFAFDHCVLKKARYAHIFATQKLDEQQADKIHLNYDNMVKKFNELEKADDIDLIPEHILW